MIGRFGTQLKSDQSGAELQQFHSLRGKFLLRLEQCTAGVAIMTIMPMFVNKLVEGTNTFPNIPNCKQML